MLLLLLLKLLPLITMLRLLRPPVLLLLLLFTLCKLLRPLLLLLTVHFLLSLLAPLLLVLLLLLLLLPLSWIASATIARCTAACAHKRVAPAYSHLGVRGRGRCDAVLLLLLPLLLMLVIGASISAAARLLLLLQLRRSQQLWHRTVWVHVLLLSLLPLRDLLPSADVIARTCGRSCLIDAFRDRDSSPTKGARLL